MGHALAALLHQLVDLPPLGSGGLLDHPEEEGEGLHGAVQGGGPRDELEVAAELRGELLETRHSWGKKVIVWVKLVQDVLDVSEGGEHLVENVLEAVTLN